MRKTLLLLFLTVAACLGANLQAQNNIDVITLSKFTDYTPGGNKWFTNMSFGSDATYSGYVKIANDESGIVFPSKSDAFYVDKTIEKGTVKSIAMTFLTNGEVEVYLANRKLSMSGGSDVMRYTISSSDPVLNVPGDFQYFIFRNAGSECIVSMVTVVWQVEGAVAEPVSVPALQVNGVDFNASSPLDLAGEVKHISFTHSNPDAAIYYLWEPDNEPGLPLYNLYTEPLEINATGTLSYYAELNGAESDVTEVKVIGQPYVEKIEVPALMVDGQPYDPATPLDLAGTPKQVALTHADAESAIYYCWTPEAATEAAADYVLYTAPLEITAAGTLTYYAELNDVQSDVTELKVIGEVIEDGINKILISNASTEWFDLQGRKVSGAARGIFISREGKKICK